MRNACLGQPKLHVIAKSCKRNSGNTSNIVHTVLPIHPCIPLLKNEYQVDYVTCYTYKIGRYVVKIFTYIQFSKD